MRLKELRERERWSQAELARTLQISSSTVSSWERGITSPSAERAKQIADLFGVTTQYLLGNEGTQNNSQEAEEFEPLEVIKQLRGKVFQLEQENKRLTEESSKVAASLTKTLYAKSKAVRDLQQQQKKNKLLTVICLLCAVVLAFVILNPRTKEAELQNELTASQKEVKKLTEQVDSLSGQVVSLAAKLTKTVPTSSAQAVSLQNEDATIMVWVPATGKRYHDSRSCAGDSPSLVTLAEAKARGYTPCGRCDPPY